MKPWFPPVLTIGSVLLALGSIKLFGDMWLRSQHADYVDASAHHDKCAAARKDFFEDCYKWHGRADCEALWAQKRGTVFNGDPLNEWVKEIDCSSETKP